EEFWYEFAPAHFLSALDEAVLIKSETDDLGITHLRYQQTYAGVPVEGSEITVHLDEKERIFLAHGKWASNLAIAVDQQSLVEETEAIQVAIREINAITYAWESEELEELLQHQLDDPAASHDPEGELKIVRTYKSIGEQNVQEVHRLVWEMQIYALNPHQTWLVQVDAQTGTLWQKREMSRNCNVVTGTCNTLYDGTRNFTVQQNGSDYTLQDCNRKIESLKVTNQPAPTNSNANWGNNHRIATTSLWAAQQIFDYLLTEHSWRGLNNSTLWTKVYYNAPISLYSGLNYISIGVNGLGNSEATLDIVGHEWMHGVDRFTADLDNTREPGAIGEGYSDIFGTLAERYGLYGTGWNWTIGEKAGIILRNIQDPRSTGNPNVVWGGDYFNPSPASCPTPDPVTNNNCGIHQNSTIVSLCFYLLAEGGSQNGGIVVPAVGIDKAAKIAFRALRYHLQTNSQFSDARSAWIQAARSLYGPCSLEEFACQRAWAAVGVGSSPTTHCATISGPSSFCYDGFLPTYTANTVAGASLNWTIPSGWTVQFSGSNNEHATVTNIAPWAYQYSNVTLSVSSTWNGTTVSDNHAISISSCFQYRSAGPRHQEVRFFPQPAQDYVQIEVPADLLPATFSVFDGVGRAVLTHSLTQTEQKVPLHQLATGMYVGQVRTSQASLISHSLYIQP
ncbi:MAG: M4 family metallopeptidase, partial [Bacteroidota bacterium]